MKYLSILIIGLLMAFSATMNAQNGYSIADAITVDMSTSPVVITGASSQYSTGFASGMQGDCPSLENNVIVYKVIIPSEGSLYASFTTSPYAYSPRSAMILFTGNNPTTWSDLTRLSDLHYLPYYGDGNGCDIGDSIYTDTRDGQVFLIGVRI